MKTSAKVAVSGSAGRGGAVSPMRHSWALIAGLVSLAALVGVWRFSTGTARTGQDTGPGPPRVEKALSQSPEWVDFHLPELSDGGYNLALYNRRIPFLMDMNGAVVHTWPDVRAAGRATLLPTGQLDVLTDRGHLEEYDWEGRKTWSFESAQSSQMLHHDFARLRDHGDIVQHTLTRVILEADVIELVRGAPDDVAEKAEGRGHDARDQVEDGAEDEVPDAEFRIVESPFQAAEYDRGTLGGDVLPSHFLFEVVGTSRQGESHA